MRSILAQFDYTNIVLEWTSKGVPFQIHPYVPEVHPVTKTAFCEREDEAHILKVCNFPSYMYMYMLAHKCTDACTLL